MKAVMLASGGLDSAVTAALARQQGYELYFLTVAYGQRNRVEVERAQDLGKFFGVRDHRVVTIDLGAIGGSALTDHIAVPKGRSEAERRVGIPSTFVPGRNTIFLALALGYADLLEAEAIFIGVHILDYSGYPDCRPEFLEAFQHVARLGSRMGTLGREIKICAPVVRLTKAEIIRKGQELNIPFHLTHTCYDPQEGGTACGQCDSCLIRQEGFREAGLEDPIPYAVSS